MSAPMLRPTGQAAAEMELLAQLGLPASASPEDVDQLHQAVSDYLSSAPPEIRGWARAQVAALDAAYITLTDPAGLEGSALRSPASPPVAPEEPATPPAPRGPDSEATSVASEEAVPADADVLSGESEIEDLAALYAMVTPSAHDDMKPGAKQPKPTAAPRAAQPAVAATAPAGPNIWKRITLGGAAVIAIVAVAFGANAIVNPAPSSGTPAASQVAAATSGAPAIDEAKVADLMSKVQADPKDVATLMALADEFYAGGQFETSATWLDKLLAIDPEHIQGLLARGAVYFNLDDLASAESTWKKVAVLEPDNVEVHYDLGFLYLNQRHAQTGPASRRSGTRSSSSTRAPSWPRRSGRTSSRWPGPPCCPAAPRRERGTRRPPRPPRPPHRPGRLPGGERRTVIELGSALGIGIAFIGGLVSFASPCCLPLVPAYISYMVGATGEGTTGRRPAFFHGLAFVAGFSLVFVAFFALIGALGAFIDRRIMNMVGGALLVFMGLQVAGVINVRALWRDTRSMPTMGGGLVMVGGNGGNGGNGAAASPRSARTRRATRAPSCSAWRSPRAGARASARSSAGSWAWPPRARASPPARCCWSPTRPASRSRSSRWRWAPRGCPSG